MNPVGFPFHFDLFRDISRAIDFRSSESGSSRLFRIRKFRKVVPQPVFGNLGEGVANLRNGDISKLAGLHILSTDLLLR